MKHGFARNGISNRTYAAWENMHARCGRPSHPNFKDYGARGISVCDRWKEFANFLADMGEPVDGLSLDRIDNDRNYEPSNCRWATRKQQNLNRRNNRLLTFAGQTKPLTEWAESFGRTVHAVRMRLDRGWSVEKALTTSQQKKTFKKAGAQ